MAHRSEPFATSSWRRRDLLNLVSLDAVLRVHRHIPAFVLVMTAVLIEKVRWSDCSQLFDSPSQKIACVGCAIGLGIEISSLVTWHQRPRLQKFVDKRIPFARRRITIIASKSDFNGASIEVEHSQLFPSHCYNTALPSLSLDGKVTLMLACNSEICTMRRKRRVKVQARPGG